MHTDEQAESWASDGAVARAINVRTLDALRALDPSGLDAVDCKLERILCALENIEEGLAELLLAQEPDDPAHVARLHEIAARLNAMAPSLPPTPSGHSNG